jgi:Copper amine oxidase N-terminal domain
VLWKHPAARLLVGVAVALFGSLTLAGAQQPPAPAPGSSADFGTPPSGEVEILFNDRHVYAKPDRLKQNRVLAALVRGNTILIPLRSMFEQMGATVSYDPAAKTAHVSKPGSDVQVTVGRPEVSINGEPRPLDVPPEIYKGAIVVPIRVISEGLGAYVQWVPDKRVVVVRYVAAAPPTPPPTPTPTAPPTPTPTAPPTPTPKPAPKPAEVHFAVLDYVIAPTVYNEFSPGNNRIGASATARVGTEFHLGGIPFMLEADGRQYQYSHYGTLDNLVRRNTTCGPSLADNQSCVTTIGGKSSVYVPSSLLLDRDIDGRFGYRLFPGRFYIAGSYLWRNTNYGYPQQHGIGFGLEKLPDLDRGVSVYFNWYYYPNVKASYIDPTSRISYDLTYAVQKIGGGLTLRLVRLGPTSSIFFDAGFTADIGKNKAFAPDDFRHYGAYGGLGVNL